MNWNTHSGSPAAVQACPESNPFSRHSPPPRVTRRTELSTRTVPITPAAFGRSPERGSVTRSHPDPADNSSVIFRRNPLI
jgi:hypothetical protein